MKILLWVLFALSAFGLFQSVQRQGDGQRQVLVESSLSASLGHLEAEADQIFNELLPIAFDSSKAEWGFSLKKKRWYVMVYDQGRKIFWNSNKVALDTTGLSTLTFPVYFTYGDDFYVLYSRPGAYLAFRLANDGQLHPKVLKDHPGLEGYGLNSRISGYQQPGPLVFEQVKQGSKYSWIWLVLTYLLGMCLFLIYLDKDNWVMSAVLIVLILGLDGVVWIYSQEGVWAGELFRPELYASANFLNSLGVLLGHLLASVPVLLFLRKLANRLTIPLLGRIFIYLLVFFSADLVLDVIESLVLDSNISFNFVELYGINGYTFLALSITAFLLLSLWFFVGVSRLPENLFSSRGWYWIALAALLFIGFLMWDASRPLPGLLYAVLVVLLAAVVIHLIQSPRQRVIALFLYGVIVATVLLGQAQHEREGNYIGLYASKLITNQDIQAEYILKSFEDKLALEFLSPEDYENFGEIKDRVENRLKRLYFSNYLERYDLRMISFDSLGNNINQNSLYSFEDLDDALNYNSRRTVSNYFYQINNPVKFNGYIAKYENCDLYGHYGTTFILLQPRLIQSEFLYPEAFANQKKRELINLDDYSYGVYYNNRLIVQKGSYTYSLDQAPAQTHNLMFHEGDYHHYVYPSGMFRVVLSKQDPLVKTTLSSFTFTFLFMLPLAFLILGLAYLYLGRSDEAVAALFDYEGRFLSTRIQVSLTLILLMGLLLSVYIIIGYIQSNYTKNLESNLLNTVKNIGQQFQNKVDLEKKLANEETRQLILNEESGAFKVDLNLFDSTGVLLSSTKAYLLQEQIVGDVMNPTAFSHMSKDKFSQLLVKEELEGTEFLSAYVPLFDGKNKVIGYLNTPYFRQE